MQGCFFAADLHTSLRECNALVVIEAPITELLLGYSLHAICTVEAPLRAHGPAAAGVCVEVGQLLIPMLCLLRVDFLAELTSLLSCTWMWPA